MEQGRIYSEISICNAIVNKDLDNLKLYLLSKKDFKILCDSKSKQFIRNKLSDLSNSINNRKSFWSKFKRL